MINQVRCFMKIKKTERGQSLVELAISITIVVYLLSGAVEFGIAFFQFVQLRDASQEGALYGSLHPDAEDLIKARVRGVFASPIELNDTATVLVDVIATDKTTGNPKALNVACVGDGLTVTVSFDHQIFMPVIPQLIGRPEIPLVATVTDTILNSTAAGCP